MSEWFSIAFDVDMEHAIPSVVNPLMDRELKVLRERLSTLKYVENAPPVVHMERDDLRDVLRYRIEMTMVPGPGATEVDVAVMNDCKRGV